MKKRKLGFAVVLIIAMLTAVLLSACGKESYQIKFVTYDGSPLTTVVYTQDEAVKWEAGEPTRSSDAEYTYTFAGWADEDGTVWPSDQLPNATANATYTATYSTTVNKYDIVFMNGEDTLSTVNLAYGAAVVYDGEQPTKAATAENEYAFIGWATEENADEALSTIPAVTGAATYYAVFSATAREYTVTWNVGGVLDTDDVAYGSVPAYSGTAPTKAATAQYTYTFEGWATEENADEALSTLPAVTGAVTYYAVFSATVNTYTVNFVGENGSVLQNTAFAYGATPVYSGTTPTKTATAQYTYAFAGWAAVENAEDPLTTIPSVTGEATYYAVFTSTENTFVIQFKDDDGEVLQNTAFAYGAKPVYSGTEPRKEATAQYTYAFAGWEDNAGTVWPSDQIPNVSAAATYTAKYNSTVNEYVVAFVNGSQTLQSESLAYGAEVSYKGEQPTKASTAENEYDFIGWATTAEATEALSALPTVTGAATYYAIFEATLQKYVITWNVDGQISTERVEYGEVPQYSGETPTKQNTLQYTYSFAGWATTANAEEALDSLPTVAGVATYYAVFTATPNTFKIEFVDGDGEVLQDTAFAYGTTPVYSGTTPTKTATAQYTYTFNGWLVDGVVYGVGDSLPEVIGATRYVASFSNTVNKYVVTWNIDGETSQVSFDFGATPVYSGTPERAPTAEYEYTFIGWATTEGASEALDTLPTVSGTATYYAVFRQSARTYLVEFYVNGEVVESDNVVGGGAPTFGGVTPTKEATEQYTYVFEGWARTEGGDPVVLAEEEITGDTKYYAVFSATANTYRIVFLSENGELLQDSQVAYGTVPQYSGEAQTKENTDHYTYAFAGWTDSVTTHATLPTVTGAAVYRAVFSSTSANYTVTINYVVEGGEVEAPESKTITGKYGTEYGKEQTLTPEIEGYLPNYFWLGGVITADTTLTVTYTKADVWDGTYPTVDGYTLEGEGTEASPYLIQSAQDLAYLSAASYKANYGTGLFYQMTTSIDLNDLAFKPICYSDVETSANVKYAFGGTFLGDGYTIAGLNCMYTNKCGVGLFGKITSGAVSNLTIEGNIAARHRAGGLTFWAYGSTLTNIISFVNAELVGTQVNNHIYIGGIVGTMGNDSVMTNCVNYGDVRSKAAIVGGISGFFGKVTVTGCANYGSVISEYSAIGGITGQCNATTFINCTNYGPVEGRSGVAGIAGEFDKDGTATTFEGCINYGAITSNYRTAGILGHYNNAAETTTINNCVNYGAITATGTTYASTATVTDGYTIVAPYSSSAYSVGGIAGWFGRGTITNCANYGDVTGNVRAIGGIMGNAAKYVTISGAKNYGTVTAIDYADMTGGIAGICAGAITDSNNYGDVIGRVLVGGIAGNVNSASAEEPANVSGCNNFGKVVGSATFHLKNDTVYDAYQMIGGIAGRVTGVGAVFANSKNFGSVTATNEDALYAGGAVGWSNQAMSGVENYGIVQGYESVGGLVGFGEELATESTNVGIVIVKTSV